MTFTPPTKLSTGQDYVGEAHAGARGSERAWIYTAVGNHARHTALIQSEIEALMPTPTSAVMAATAEKRDYVVTLRFKFPAWDERDGLRYNVRATGKADAIRRAKSQANADGHLIGRGRYTFTAELEIE